MSALITPISKKGRHNKDLHRRKTQVVKIICTFVYYSHQTQKKAKKYKVAFKKKLLSQERSAYDTHFEKFLIKLTSYQKYYVQVVTVLKKAHSGSIYQDRNMTSRQHDLRIFDQQEFRSRLLLRLMLHIQ